MKTLKLLHRNLLYILLTCVLCVGCGYRTDVTLRFEGGNKYKIDKWIWYKGDAICMQWYDVYTDNVDSLYKATITDCDSIIARHKRAVANAR